MDESHSDINDAFGPHRSVSSQFGDHHLLSSLLDIKRDLSTEVRALTKRMSHIDEQISQIFHFLSPENTLVANISTPDERKSPGLLPSSLQIPSPGVPLSPLIAPLSPEATNTNYVTMSPLFEAPSFYSDLNPNLALFSTNQSSPTVSDAHDLPRVSRLSEPTITTSPERRISGVDSNTLSILPSSIYNRSASSSITSLGISSASRSSVSNKIAPAPVPSSPVNPKQPLSTTFQPISNTRFNPGHSPKPKSRSHSTRTNKLQQYAEKSTVIEMEPSSSQEQPNKSSPLLGTLSKAPSGATAKLSSGVFRRFRTGGNNSEKNATSSIGLLYPRTSDDEHPASPGSSGNEDDDYRPLTSSNKHQTLL